MKKTISILGAVFLIFGNGVIADLFPEHIRLAIGLVCIFLGAVLGVIFLGEEERRLVCLVNIFKRQEEQTMIISQKISELTVLEDAIKCMEKDLLENMHVWTDDIEKSMDRNGQIVIECLEKIQLQMKNDYDKRKEVVDKMQMSIYDEVIELNSMATNIHADVIKGHEKAKDAQRIASVIAELPKRMCQMQDELIDKLTDSALDNSRCIIEFAENVQDDFKSLTKEVRNELRKTLDSMEDHEEKISQEIQNLAQQYQDFKEYNNEMIHKMTLMSNEDYELLKGLFDGKKKRRN